MSISMSNKPPDLREFVPQAALKTSASVLRDTYEKEQALFEAQPPSVQRFLELQARTVADALLQRASQVQFRLPDRVVLNVSGHITPVPAQFHEQSVSGLVTGLVGVDIRVLLRHHLAELESSPDETAAAMAQLIRYTTAHTMIHDLLPSGRSVTYAAPEGEEIACVPVTDTDEPASAITTETDAITEDNGGAEARGELVVPYVPTARRFYLPQWVAFDEDGKLLVNSLQEAESTIASMQHFLAILHAAVGFAPYFVVDEEYQRKRYGILGQLVNQGRALALYRTGEIIDTIRHRAAANELNRGLSLSLPYFDDQELQLKLHDFQIIPAGRIMFIPAFVGRAAREEQAKVAQDTRLSASTRKYLLQELDALEAAFASLSR